MQPLLQPELSGGTRWQRLALAVWAAILVVLSIRGLLNARENSVYPIYAGAARNFLDGTELYTARMSPYRYSPLVAALFVPFSLLSDPVGGVLWRLLNAAVYLGSFAWWCRVVLPRCLTASQTAILFLFIVPLSVGSLNNAQSNLLVLGLLLAGTAAVACRRWNLASGCVALACLFKLYPISVGLLLAAVYPRRFAGRFLLALAIGLTVPFLLKPSAYVWEQYAGWWRHLTADNRHQLQVELWYRDLRLLCHNWHLTLSPKAYRMIQVLAAAAIAAWCVWAKLARWEQQRLLTLLLALGCCWMTLLGPTTESCTYIFVAPTLAWTLLDAWLAPRPIGLRYGLAVSLGLFTVSRMAVWFPGGARHLQVAGLQPLAALVLLVCVVAMEVHASLTGEITRRERGDFQSLQAA